MYTIVTSINSKYLKKLNILVNSARRNKCNCNFYIKAIECQNILLSGSDITISYDRNSNILKNSARYASNKKYEALYEALSFSDNIILTDADTIIRKNIDDIFDGIKDIGVFNCDLDPKKLEHVQYYMKKFNHSFPEYMFQGGMLLVKRNKKTIAVAEKLKNFFCDDEFMYKPNEYIVSHTLQNSDLKIKILDNTYKDFTLKRDSHVWSGRGKAKDSIVYKIEEIKYLK
jgi:hypothetical protein